MQGRERADRPLLDAQALVGHLVPAGSMFAFLAAHRGELFTEGDFADMFPSGRGRPSVPASVMASVMVLQVLHDYSDAEAAEAARCDLRWKAACGFPLDHGGFDPSTLVYWRRRVASSDRPYRISDAVAKVITESGILRGRRRRAVDSTILADAVATQDTITQLIAAVRRVGREVPGAAEIVAGVCTGHDYRSPGKPRIDWDDPAATYTLVSALVNDANALVAALQDRDLGERAASAVGLLALIAGQDVEPAERSDGTDGRWRIARKVAGDRVISVHDPEARHTRKSPENRRDGYRAHVVACAETGIITGEQLTGAAGEDNSDAAVAAQFLAGQVASGGPACEWYGDTAYGSGDLRAEISQAGHTAVIKPGPVKAPVAGGFTADDFTVDEGAGTVTCPAGVARRITAHRSVIFGVACRGCPLRARCTTAKEGRSLRLHPHDAILRADRAPRRAGNLELHHPPRRTRQAGGRPTRPAAARPRRGPARPGRSPADRYESPRAGRAGRRAGPAARRPLRTTPLRTTRRPPPPGQGQARPARVHQCRQGPDRDRLSAADLLSARAVRDAGGQHRADRRGDHRDRQGPGRAQAPDRAHRPAFHQRGSAAGLPGNRHRPEPAESAGDPGQPGADRDEPAGAGEADRAAGNAASRQAQRRNHRRRGGDRQSGARGGIFYEKITDAERVLAVILGLRKICTWEIVAELFEVSRRTIGNASAWVRPLLDQEQCTISRSATRYSSAAAVLAAVAGQESVSARPETPL